MGGLVDTMKRFKRERVQGMAARIVRETVEEFSGSLVAEWTPYGQPETWRAPPPAGYQPGNLQSSWFLQIGSASTETTEATDHRQVWHIERLADLKPSETVYISNSAPHASAIEYGHSMQAPTGIMVNAIEFEPMAYNVARRIAG